MLRITGAGTALAGPERGARAASRPPNRPMRPHNRPRPPAERSAPAPGEGFGRFPGRPGAGQGPRVVLQ